MKNHRSYVINDQIIHVSVKDKNRYSKFNAINRMIFKHNLDINNSKKINLKYFVSSCFLALLITTSVHYIFSELLLVPLPSGSLIN